MAKVLVVLSGGMDSATMLAVAVANKNEIQCITFDYGSKHNHKEFNRAQALCSFYGVPLTRIPLGFISTYFKSDLLKSGGEIPEGHYEAENMSKTVVPFRNGIMLAIATGFAESIGYQQVWIGNHCGDHAVYPDCRADFIAAMAGAMCEGTYANIYLHSPFGENTKAEIVKCGVDLKVPYELTWSCYKGEEKHCGRCGTCVERLEAFKLADAIDPVEYEDRAYFETVLKS